MAVELLIYMVVVLALTWMLATWIKKPINLPPMPALPFPVLGHIPLMSKNPREKMLKWAESTGDLMSLYMGTTHVVVFNTYDLLKETLVKQADYFSDRPPNFTTHSLKDGEKGILSNSGPSWKEQRSVTVAILRSFGMGKNFLAERIQDEVSAYLTELSKLKGEASDVRTLTNASVANVICAIIVGKRFEYNDPFFLKFLYNFNEQVALSAGTALLNWFPWLRFLPGDLFKAKKLVNNKKELAVYFSTHYVKMVTETYDENNIDNFISAYMKHQQQKEQKGEETSLCDAQLQRVISNLFIAGSETTSTTILWFILFMIHHPDIQKKIFRELEDVVGLARMPSVSDKPRLNYLNAAIMETQRRASIIPFSLTHMCTADLTVRGFNIPKGTRIWPNLDAVLLDKKTWGDPMNFRPERFLDSHGNVQVPEQFAPFSLGRRICLGESLAKMELFLFLSALIQRFEMLPANSECFPPTEGRLGITVSPLPFEVRLIDRSSC